MVKSVLNPTAYAKLQFKIYRYRFLMVYVVIGFTSLMLEVLTLRGLQNFGVNFIGAQGAGLVVSVFFAYWMNVRFNFKVPIAKRNRALAYFSAISICSALANY